MLCPCHPSASRCLLQLLCEGNHSKGWCMQRRTGGCSGCCDGALPQPPDDYDANWLPSPCTDDLFGKVGVAPRLRWRQRPTARQPKAGSLRHAHLQIELANLLVDNLPIAHDPPLRKSARIATEQARRANRAVSKQFGVARREDANRHCGLFLVGGWGNLAGLDNCAGWGNWGGLNSRFADCACSEERSNKTEQHSLDHGSLRNSAMCYWLDGHHSVQTSSGNMAM